MNIQRLYQWNKTYGLVNVILRAIYTKLPIIPMSNAELLRRMNWQMRSRKKLRKYIKICDTIPELEKQNKYPDTIWFMWLQGLDKAPKIVKKCYESIKHNMKDLGYEIVVLEKSNMFDYVNLPDYIIEKWEKGIIGNAHFSDLCRIALLCDYGGLWLDATTFLTGPIDSEIFEEDYFFLQASYLDFSATKISNWLMYAKLPGIGFLLSVKETLINYWRKKDVVDDYFLFHLTVAEISQYKEFKSEFDNMSFISNTYSLLMGRELNKSFDRRKFEFIVKHSNIHKLSYKDLNESGDDTYYKYILEMEFSNESKSCSCSCDI